MYLSPIQESNNASAMQLAQAAIAARNEAAVQEIAEEVHEFCGECEACQNRMYQDDSLDGGVSFQQPTHIPANQAAIAVFGHEREHQSREARFAAEEGREVLINDITVFTSLCIECGRIIISGGETRTVTREAPEQPTMSMLDVFATREI
jgi:hypothetical protein